MYTLLVIDMQPGFLKRFTEYHNDMTKDEVIHEVQKAVIRAIADGAEIIDVNYDDSCGDMGDTIEPISNLWKGYKKLFKHRISYVRKSFDGGGDAVMQNGIAENEIRVCGINAGACVRDTVYQLACDYDQQVTVIGKAVANAWNDSVERDLHYLEEYATIE